MPWRSAPAASTSQPTGQKALVDEATLSWALPSYSLHGRCDRHTSCTVSASFASRFGSKLICISSPSTYQIHTHTNFCSPGRLVPCLTLKSAIKILPNIRMTASLPPGIKGRVLQLQASCWRTNQSTKQGIQVLKLCCPWKQKYLHGSSENHHKKTQVQWWGWMKLEHARRTSWVLAWSAIGNQKSLSCLWVISSPVLKWLYEFGLPLQFSSLSAQ